MTTAPPVESNTPEEYPQSMKPILDAEKVIDVDIERMASAVELMQAEIDSLPVAPKKNGPGVLRRSPNPNYREHPERLRDDIGESRFDLQDLEGKRAMILRRKQGMMVAVEGGLELDSELATIVDARARIIEAFALGLKQTDAAASPDQPKSEYAYIAEATKLFDLLLAPQIETQ